MERMGAFIVKARPVHGIHAEKFHATGVNQGREAADQALAFEFPFVASACGKSQQRRAPVAVHHDPQFHSQAMRIPAVIFPFHVAPARRRAPGTRASAWSARYYTAFACWRNGKNPPWGRQFSD